MTKNKKSYQTAKTASGFECCPECKSVKIQYDNAVYMCYCLMRTCSHRWNPYQDREFDPRRVKNPDLRASMHSLPSMEMTERLHNLAQTAREEKHGQIVSVLMEHGKSYPKKHGKWIKYDFPNKYFVSLDTHNHNVNFCCGTGAYDKWTGFEGKVRQHVGMNFGGFSCQLSLEALDAFHNRLTEYEKNKKTDIASAPEL
jgi:hypothetical protein